MKKIIILLLAFYMVACTQKIKLEDTARQEKDPEAYLRVENKFFNTESEEKLIEEIQKIPLYNHAFIGLCMYDLQKKQYLVRYNHQRYFTPASNTKLYTYFAATQLIGDSLPALQYIQKQDSLIIWGTADPIFLHPSFKNSVVFDFLKDSKQKIYFSDSNFSDDFFGYGWAWSDYEADYSAEKYIFPMYGNVVSFVGKPDKKLDIFPKFFSKFVQKDDKLLTENWILKRNYADNQFFYKINNLKTKEYIAIPYKTSGELTAQMLSDTLKKNISYVKRPILKDEIPKMLYSISADTVYRLMLQSSDNFLAEHILLMCQQKLNKNKINSQIVIDSLLQKQLKNLSQMPRWVDGSGLSRYNLFTPQSNVELLIKLYEGKKSEENLFSLLPAGGVSGTLKTYFKAEKPFIFAKTGTLSNNHNLSGYLVTKSGKRLAFSFMNNHYMVSTKSIRIQMQKILMDFYTNY